jgi:hypothetical protein
VGTRRSQLKQFEAELLQQDWRQVQPEVELKTVPRERTQNSLLPKAQDACLEIEASKCTVSCVADSHSCV